MLQALDVQPGQRVLEIGAGTGYNAALLATAAGRSGRVVSMELNPDTARRARAALRRAGSRARVVVGDGHEGHPGAGPYDRIIATAASPTVPRAWFDQLVEGGLLQFPYQRVGLGAVPTLVKVGGRLVTRSVLLGGFMSMRGAAHEVAHQDDQVSVAFVRRGESHRDALFGHRIEGMSMAARRCLQHLLVDGPSTRRWRGDLDPIGFLLLAERACQYGGTRGWGAALVDRSGRRAAAIVRTVDGRRVLSWGHSASDLLDDSLGRWRRLDRPTLDRLRLAVDFPDGATARIRHSWRTVGVTAGSADDHELVGGA